MYVPKDYRLDNENRLYDIENDRGQQTDIANKLPILRDSLVKAKTEWLEEVDPKTVETDDRPFTLGHPSYLFTQIPSRDGIPHTVASNAATNILTTVFSVIGKM